MQTLKRTLDARSGVHPVLAIVGSFKWPNSSWEWVVKGSIVTNLRLFDPLLVISGDSPKGGVDKWTEDCCKMYNYDFRAFPPATADWEGYRERNLQIAAKCDILVAIRSPSTETYGSGWTADRAEHDFQKEVYRIQF